METIAEFMKEVTVDLKKPEVVKGEVSEFRKEFQEVKYCFPAKTKAYEYISFK